MPLDVLRNVRQQPDHGGRQAFAPHRAEFAESRRIERPHNRLGTRENAIQLRQKVVAAGALRLPFRLQRGHLLLPKLEALQISDEPVGAPGYVAQVKANRSAFMRHGPKLVVRHPRGVPDQVLPSLLESIKNGRERRVDACNRAAQPWFFHDSIVGTVQDRPPHRPVGIYVALSRCWLFSFQGAFPANQIPPRPSLLESF
jgi:hypothetical protein